MCWKRDLKRPPKRATKKKIFCKFELHGSEKRLAPTEKERTSVEMKVMCLEKKLEESDTSLAQALSVASAKT